MPLAVEVDLGTDPPQVLSAITTFDASRARVSVTKPNVVEHIPKPLRLLTLLSETQYELAETLRGHRDHIRAGLPALPEVAPDTRAGAGLADLGGATDADALLKDLSLSAE